MLASLNFICSSLHNNQARIYRRETFLREAVMRVEGLHCFACGAAIPQWAKYANTPGMTRLCSRCYGELPEALACAAVRFETILCVGVRRMLYREVWLYEFVGEAVLVFRPDGRELRFANLRRAQAWVDWACEHGCVAV